MRKLVGWVCAAGFSAAAVGLFWDATTQDTTAPLTAAEAPLQQRQNFPQQNQIAPDFALQDLEGNTVRLSDTHGKIRIVDFWATWCPPCQAEIPQFNALQAKYPDDVVVIGIALDREGSSAVKPFAQNHTIAYPLVIGDAKTVVDFGRIESIPTTFVIDREGRFYNKHVGYKPGSIFEKDILALRKRTNL